MDPTRLLMLEIMVVAVQIDIHTVAFQ